MALDPGALTLAFRRGQLDALAATHLAKGGLYTPEMQQTLALRLLGRAWQQYREDRAITLGSRLVGAECAAERDAFLALLARALPSPSVPLMEAIRTVRRIAVAPLAAEARQAAEIEAQSTAQLDAVIATLESRRLPDEPLERLLAIVNQHRYSLGPAGEALAATAHSPCWAVNLLGIARPEAFALCAVPLPSPALVQRRLWRADLSNEAQRSRARDGLLDALQDLGCDIDRVWRASRRFEAEFPHLRSHARLGHAWHLMVGLGELTPAQLARALPATKAGAGKLLRQLADARFVRAGGPFEPFACSPLPSAAFGAVAP